MLLTEDIGKALLADAGIPTPRGVLVRCEADLAQAAAAFDGPVVLKAQILAGGRGKGGGIKLARDAAAMHEAFQALHDSVVNGHRVTDVLIEEAIPFVAERYIGLLVDCGQVWLLIGAKGGVDIEAVSKDHPETMARIAVAGETGPNLDEVGGACTALGIKNLDDFLPMVARLYRCFVDNDATTAEINPVAECADGRSIALDARIVIDDAALFRHPRFVLKAAAAAGKKQSPPMLAAMKTLSPEGRIGYAGIGGGLALTVADWLSGRGIQVNALIDIDDWVAAGQTAQVVSAFLDAMDEDPHVQAILINAITCGYQTPAIATDLLGVLAARPARLAKTVVINLHGTGEDEAEGVFQAHGVVNSHSIANAIDRVAAIVGGAAI